MFDSIRIHSPRLTAGRGQSMRPIWNIRMKTWSIIVMIILLVSLQVGTIQSGKNLLSLSVEKEAPDSGGETITILDDRGQYLTTPTRSVGWSSSWRTP